MSTVQQIKTIEDLIIFLGETWDFADRGSDVMYAADVIWKQVFENPKTIEDFPSPTVQLRWVKASEKPLPEKAKSGDRLNVRDNGLPNTIFYLEGLWYWGVSNEEENCPVRDQELGNLEYLEETPLPDTTQDVEQLANEYVERELSSYNQRYQQAGRKDFIAGYKAAQSNPAPLPENTDASNKMVSLLDFILKEAMLTRDTYWFDAGKHLSSKEVVEMFNPEYATTENADRMFTVEDVIGFTEWAVNNFRFCGLKSVGSKETYWVDDLQLHPAEWSTAELFKEYTNSPSTPIAEKGESRDYSKFFTPPHIASFIMASLLDPQPGAVYLEPSAGHGALVKAVKEKCPESIVFAYDINPEFEKPIRNAGANVVVIKDFLSMPVMARFNGCIANPPFGNENRIEDHFNHICRNVKTGGKIVMIVPASFTPEIEHTTHPIENWSKNSDGSLTPIKIIELSNPSTPPTA